MFAPPIMIMIQMQLAFIINNSSVPVILGIRTHMHTGGDVTLGPYIRTA